MRCIFLSSNVTPATLDWVLQSFIWCGAANHREAGHCLGFGLLLNSWFVPPPDPAGSSAALGKWWSTIWEHRFVDKELQHSDRCRNCCRCGRYLAFVLLHSLHTPHIMIVSWKNESLQQKRQNTCAVQSCCSHIEMGGQCWWCSRNHLRPDSILFTPSSAPSGLSACFFAQGLRIWKWKWRGRKWEWWNLWFATGHHRLPSSVPHKASARWNLDFHHSPTRSFTHSPTYKNRPLPMHTGTHI